MLELLKPFLASGPFIPHGHCYLWQLDLVWLHLISDALIALAYYSIPVMLVHFVKKRQDLPFNWIFILFGIFIIACGTTHIMEIWTLWHPTYWLSGFIKAITAVASLYTALMLLKLIPQALALPSPAQLETANRSLQEQIVERQRAELAVKQAYEELEFKVEERTTELKKINEQLRNEIIERQRLEEEVRFLQTMTQAISESLDFHSAIEIVLRKVCDVMGWQFGEAWIPTPDGKTLECSSAWYGSNQNLEFRQSSEGLKFTPATGLPGRVWTSKLIEWIDDFSSVPDTVFLRSKLAIEADFKAGFGIPITNYSTEGEEPQVVAVLVFFMSHLSQEEDKRRVEVVSTVANQLASLLQRKQAKASLRASEERFRLLVETVQDYAILMLDTDGYIVSWNAGAERIKGYREEEILGRHFSCFYPKEDIALGKPEQQLKAAAFDQIEDEGWRVRKDGSQFWANVIITPLRDEEARLCGFAKVTRDITERQRTQQALQESEERLNAVLDNSIALIYVKNIQGEFILVNHWYEELFHISKEQVKGKSDYDMFPKEMADIYRANDQRVLEAKAPLRWEEIVPQDDGLHTYLSIKFPLYDTAGVAYAVCGISTDITELKQAEEALLSSFATNRALLNAIPDLMFRVSRDGTFVNFKGAKDNNLLMPSKDFLGKKVYEVLPQEVATPIIDCMERALQTDEIQIFEYHLVVNNQSRDYETRIVVSAKDEVMAIVRDITERKRAEEDIRNALEKQKELSELRSHFVTMTSHEFRTPLTTILSSAQLLEKYSNKMAEEKKLQHLYRIQTAVNHMTQMLNNVLLFGKADVGKLEFKPEPVDLVKFCRDLVEELQLSTGNSHTIAFCSQGQCTTACMDEKLLLCILSNLLSNAIKYSPQAGTIYFDLIFHQGEAIFHVQDEGIGIPVADQAQLFNSFHRASNVGTISGTGLGLAIVKKSVDLHGGKITVKSEVGVGTTFTVTLPLKTQVQTDEKNSSD